MKAAPVPAVYAASSGALVSALQSFESREDVPDGAVDGAAERWLGFFGLFWLQMSQPLQGAMIAAWRSPKYDSSLSLRHEVSEM